MSSAKVVTRPVVDIGLHVPSQSTGAPRSTVPVGRPVAATLTVAVTGNVKSTLLVLLAVPLHAPASSADPGHAVRPPSATSGAAMRAHVAIADPAMRARVVWRASGRRITRSPPRRPWRGRARGRRRGPPRPRGCPRGPPCAARG
ncbi:MAG: hypothetical protein FJW92_06190 [Actinobacteria bacterium]|nr:hypothetical protein [Actinomycetota bacterium]